jgi:hypothetical protein
MATSLSSPDYVVLGELADGPHTISAARPRDRADRLVVAGYATFRNLDIRSAEYEITDLGRIALALSQHGILSPRYTAKPQRHDSLWYLAVASERQSGPPDVHWHGDKADGPPARHRCSPSG